MRVMAGGGGRSTIAGADGCCVSGCAAVPAGEDGPDDAPSGGRLAGSTAAGFVTAERLADAVVGSGGVAGKGAAGAEGFDRRRRAAAGGSPGGSGGGPGGSGGGCGGCAMTVDRCRRKRERRVRGPRCLKPSQLSVSFLVFRLSISACLLPGSLFQSRSVCDMIAHLCPRRLLSADVSSHSAQVAFLQLSFRYGERYQSCLPGGHLLCLAGAHL